MMLRHPPVDTARMQAVPHLAEKLPPQRGELLPGRCGGNDGGRAGFGINETHLVVHPAIIAPRSLACHGAQEDHPGTRARWPWSPSVRCPTRPAANSLAHT